MKIVILLLVAISCYAQRVVTSGQITSVSGPGSTLVTTTGTQTAGNCVSIDANGNHVASGVACSPSVSTVNGASGAVTLTTSSLISTYTFSTLPTCAVGLKNVIAQVSDVGDLGSYWACLFSTHENAYQWRPVGGRLQLAVSMIPFIIPSSGTIGNNGALTLTTALPRTYAAGAYMYFPANAISSGSAAGLYWVVMSSTTAGTIYNNTYTSGLPAAPTSNTAFTTTGPGAYTQTINSTISLATFSVQGGLMGPRGELWMGGTWNSAPTANTKTPGINFASSTNPTFQITSASNTAWQSLFIVKNAESASLQEIFNGWNGTGSGGSVLTTTYGTAFAFTVAQTGKIAVATDFLVEESWEVELLRP